MRLFLIVHEINMHENATYVQKYPNHSQDEDASNESSQSKIYYY